MSEPLDRVSTLELGDLFRRAVTDERPTNHGLIERVLSVLERRLSAEDFERFNDENPLG